jgi:hypothetical protein
MIGERLQISMPWWHFREWRYSSSHYYLCSTLWVVSFRPRSLYLWGKYIGTHRVGGWVGPRSENFKEKKNFVKKLGLVKLDGFHLAQDKEKWLTLVRNMIRIRSHSPVPNTGITGLNPA